MTGNRAVLCCSVLTKCLDLYSGVISLIGHDTRSPGLGVYTAWYRGRRLRSSAIVVLIVGTKFDSKRTSIC
jgi:hypothetical protein